MAIFNPDFLSWEEAFADAVNSLQLVVPTNPIIDGKIHRLPTKGKRMNAWYVIFQDEVTGGCVGNWETGEKANWHYLPKGFNQSPKQIDDLHKKWVDAKRKADEQRSKEAKEAALSAQKRWEELTIAPEDHPYLLLKSVGAHGIRMGKGRLYVPLHDETGSIVSLQSIDDKGQKLFMQNGRVSGCHFIIGTPTGRLLIAEGYATAASIYEATGIPIAVVFNAGNIAHAIRSLKTRFPTLALTICADNDGAKTPNIGLEKAKEAAKEYSCGIIWPEFTQQEIEQKASDFNDYAKIHGKEAIRNLFSEKKKSKFSPLSFSELLRLPKPKWLIEDILTFKSFGVIYGQPESCKTFAALDMALCIAHGLQWHGRDVIQGSVLYIVGEGIGGIGKRLKAWTAQFAPKEECPPFYAITANVNFRDAQDIAELLLAIDNLNQTFSLIIIDTVARALLGGEENSTVDMGLFVNACDTIKEKSNCTVLGIHHSGKDEDRGMRGSTALLGAVDTVIYAEQAIQGIVTLSNEKQKDGEHFKDMVFKTVQIATGLMETSLILEPSEEKATYQKTLNGRLKKALQFLWDSIATDTRKIHNCPATTIENWKAMCFTRELAGDTPAAKRMAFNRAMEKLQEEKLIACEAGMVWVLNSDGENG